jgi:signal transduction histidine kinase
MRIQSIRWRLTLSYAAIACLAALALGAVLLGILRGYYSEKEREYLVSNAESFETLLTDATAEDVPINALQPQLENLAFISKVRVRVVDSRGQQLVDTGAPETPYVISFVYAASDLTLDNLRVETIRLAPLPDDAPANAEGQDQMIVSRPAAWQVQFEGQPDILAATAFIPSMQTASGTITALGGGEAVEISASEPSRPQIGMNAVSTLPLSSTFYGFSFGSTSSMRAVEGKAVPRSGQQITSPIFDASNNQIGTIILSDGPAYGSEIVRSVALGWLLAGGIAVLLAAAVGWLVSRQISKPLLALTDVTTGMMAGDLSLRANVARPDELGTLALSFNAMADQIQEIVVTLQRFVADAAHELHTPLTALRTSLEVARSETPSTAIRRAHEQVIRLEKLTDGLLALSRIEARSGSDTLTLVDLNRLIRTTSELYASRAEQANLDYELSLPDNVPPVSGWADQLGSVISNLMDNAIKFTPAGGKVSLSLHSVDQDVVLVVQDTGIGIPADDLPQLFERFRRGHNAAHFPGSGLGMAITKAIVKAHHGSIVAESSGAGTTITVRLPLAPAAQILVTEA